MEIRPAEKLSELIQAGEVIHDAYVGEGIIKPEPSGVFLHSQHLTKQGMLMVAIEDNVVIGTVGSIIDSTYGLPLDNVFGSELKRLRSNHDKIAECGVIASSERLRPSVIDTMIGYSLWWLMHMGVDFIVTSCHPDHTAFYVKRYGLEVLAPIPSRMGDKPVARYPKFGMKLVEMPGISLRQLLTNENKGARLFRADPKDEKFFEKRYLPAALPI